MALKVSKETQNDTEGITLVFSSTCRFHSSSLPDSPTRARGALLPSFPLLACWVDGHVYFLPLSVSVLGSSSLSEYQWGSLFILTVPCCTFG